jgi:hypothetical protein
MVLSVCALLSLPVAAQETRTFQPASADEFEQLEQHRSAELADLRGGDDVERAALNPKELDAFSKIAAEFPERLQQLRELRGGHVIIYIALPIVIVALVVVIILLIVLL